MQNRGKKMANSRDRRVSLAFQRPSFVERLRQLSGDELAQIQEKFAPAKERFLVEAKGNDNSTALSRLFSDIPIPFVLDGHAYQKLEAEYQNLLFYNVQFFHSSKNNEPQLTKDATPKVLKMVKKIIKIACDDLLDEAGQIRKEWVQLLGFESLVDKMQGAENIKIILKSFVNNILQHIDHSISLAAGGEDVVGTLLGSYLEKEIDIQKLDAEKRSYLANRACLAAIKNDMEGVLNSVLVEREEKRRSHSLVQSGSAFFPKKTDDNESSAQSNHNVSTNKSHKPHN